MSRMKRAWKIIQPKRKPAAYSKATSSPIGRFSSEPTTAAARMPMPSPATQCMVEPTTWRQRAAI